MSTQAPKIEPTAQTMRVYGRGADSTKVRERQTPITDKREAFTVVISSGGGISIMPDATQVDPEVEQKFRRLADQWREETFLSSSITNNLTHPAYLRIMAMGEKAIPLILKELKERGGHWFMALRYIVNEDENPVPPEHYGKIKLMTEDWLEWGRRNRYLSA